MVQLGHVGADGLGGWAGGATFSYISAILGRWAVWTNEESWVQVNAQVPKVGALQSRNTVPYIRM